MTGGVIEGSRTFLLDSGVLRVKSLLQRQVQQASGLALPSSDLNVTGQLVALLVPFAGAYLQWLFWDFLKPYAFIFFYPVLCLSSWLGGLRIGAVAGLCSAMLIWYVFVPSEMSFSIDGKGLVAVLVNTAVGAVFLLLHQSLRMTNRALLAAHQGTEARMAGIVHSAMDAIVSVDSLQHIVLFNAAAEKLFRISAQKVMGSSLDILIPGRFRTEHQGHVAGFATKGATGRSMRSLGVLMALRADGEEFPIEASISQIEVGGEKIFTVILREISERLEFEANLQAAERRLRAVTENLAEGLIISDMDGNLLHWNRAALVMHDFDELGDGLGQLSDFDRVFVLRYPGGPELALTEWPLNRVLSGEHLRDHKLIIRRRDAAWERVFRYSGSIILEQEGKPIAYLAVSDVTEQSRAQEEVRLLNQVLEQRVEERTAQLQAANKELEAFSYSVSHDLRAPLRAMDGFSRATLEDYGTLLPAEGQQFLHTICNSAKRMGNLIDDLLAFAQLGRVTLKKRSVQSNHLLEEVLVDIGPQIEGREVELTVDPLPDCLGDPSLLRQVWLNLVSNACKYTQGKSPAVVHIGAVRDGKQCVYFVRDNGAGFDMRYIDKLFGVFQRLHRADQYPGTGVGLAVVQRIVHRHGGRVWAEAEVDRGACFYFTLENGDPNAAS